VADRNGVVDIVADSCVADYCTVVVVDTVAAGSFAGLRQEQEERADNAAAVVVVGAVANQSVVEAYNTVAGCRGEPEPLVEVVTDGKPIAAAAEEQEEVVVVDSVAGQVQEDNLSLDLKQLIGEVSTMPKQTNRWPVIK
jgi:hypothetical protein